VSSNTKYPECEKLRTSRDDLLKLRQFTEWLGENGITLCSHGPTHYASKGGEYYQITENIETVIFRFLGVDAKKLEDERRAMLEEAQEKANAP
jgi:hypothetical protein